MNISYVVTDGDFKKIKDKHMFYGIFMPVLCFRSLRNDTRRLQ